MRFRDFLIARGLSCVISASYTTIPSKASPLQGVCWGFFALCCSKNTKQNTKAEEKKGEEKKLFLKIASWGGKEEKFSLLSWRHRASLSTVIRLCFRTMFVYFFRCAVVVASEIENIFLYPKFALPSSTPFLPLKTLLVQAWKSSTWGKFRLMGNESICTENILNSS